MRKKISNKNLINANQAKKDEFYTQHSDIEKELPHYRQHFNGKVVFCNCDDPTESHFWRYFASKFKEWGLKKLIATHFEAEKPSYKLEMLQGESDTVKTQLKQNGDFRSPECIEILKESDIVVTNPPFSLFREYVAQLEEYQKKFLIIGSINAITYKDCFKLIKDNQLWLGVSIHSGDREFQVPNDYPLNAANYRVDSEGHKYIRVKGVRWFTNMDYKERHENIVLSKQYTPKEYPHYDNYDAINIDKTKDIPKDYEGIMGIPITFMDKYNPDQFEIIGHTHSGDKSPEVELLRTDQKHRNRGIVHGENREKYDRILIKRIGATE
jgi:hypothetical protein